MSPHRTPHHLAIYLRDHEAAAQGGLDLARRAAAAQRHQAYADRLSELRDEIQHDLGDLRRIMRVLRVRRDPVLGALMRAGERVGRLKPNGSVLRRPALSDLIEIEALSDAVHAKANGWRALLAAGVDEVNGVPDLEGLLQRAERQSSTLQTLHQLVAARVLAIRGAS